MIDAIHFEWIKLRSVRSTMITFLVATGLVVLVAIIATSKAVKGEPHHIDLITSGVSIAQLLFGVLGVQIIGQEYRFNTIRSTFAAVPRRNRILLAKLIVIVGASAAFSVLMLALSLGVGKGILGSDLILDPTGRRVMLGVVVFGMGWAAIGFAVGAIVRQPVAGIMILLGWSFVVESIVGGVLHGTRKWLPFINGFQMMTYEPASELLSPGPAAALFFSYTAVLLAVGLVLAQRRDA